MRNMMKHRLLLTALSLTVLATVAEAGPFRRRAQPAYQPAYQYPTYTQSPSTATAAGEYVTNYTPAAVPDSASTSSDAVSPVSLTAGDGLDEVNAKRAASGLRPFIYDEGLTQAARACAAFRAEYGMFGHTSNDFAFVPAGSAASSAGCAAYPAGFGWMSCCVYDGYTYAGAAWVTGRDGRRYMHLFVR
jgi:uncharacterized protein YkwD